MLSALGDLTSIIPAPVTFPRQNRKGETVASIHPLAITMWDFSWLERRWPGAGYEDWDKILDELKDRGYNAVRIDAYPHLVAKDPMKEWTLLPVWDQQVWGSPDVNRVVVQPALNVFISKCRERRIKVGLSSWYREDVDRTMMGIRSPGMMAENWIKTLDMIEKEGLLDAILYVDLCNEWPGDLWAPYFKNDPPENTWGYWHTGKSLAWMTDAIAAVRKTYPDIPLFFSFDGDRVEYYAERDISFFDAIEHHTWMVKEHNGEFYKIVEYDYGRFSPQAYKNLAAKGEHTYRAKPEYWQKLLTDKITLLAQMAAKAKLPLITTECWGIVDYKDWPLLSWDWVKELCELGVVTAAATGQWIAIATSNFCGPQFVGMWRDVVWHRRLTEKIKSSPIRQSMLNERLVKRLASSW